MLLRYSKLISFLLILFFSSTLYAEDILIIHQNYGNTHSKHKNRLENAGHTVTMQNTSSSYSYTAANYDQVYDIRYSYTSYSTADIDRFKTVLSNGGTVYLVGENGNFDSRNDAIVSFLQEVTGDNNIAHSGNSCCGSGAKYSMNENRDILTNYSASDDMTVVASGYFSNIGTNGKWLLKDPSDSNKIVGALWDGDAMSSYANGKVVVVLDINYASHSSYYTNGDQAWIDAMITDVFVSTVNTRSATNITITSGQTTIMNTAKTATGNGVTMNITGDNNTVNIEQEGENNFVIGTDWSSASEISGASNTINIDQGNVTTSGNSGNNGLALDVTGDTNTLNISQGDYATDVGDHRMWVDIDGRTNTLTLQQRNNGTTSSEHFMSLDLDSSSNVITMQQLDNGDKTLFLDINNGNNTVDVNQSGTGEHYLDIKLGSGSYAHDVDISQTGTGNHAARVDLDGYSTDFDLNQQGSTDQDYNIDMTCGVQAGCTLSTTQGN